MRSLITVLVLCLFSWNAKAAITADLAQALDNEIDVATTQVAQTTASAVVDTLRPMTAPLGSLFTELGGGIRAAVGVLKTYAGELNKPNLAALHAMAMKGVTAQAWERFISAVAVLICFVLCLLATWGSWKWHLSMHDIHKKTYEAKKEAQEVSGGTFSWEKRTDYLDTFLAISAILFGVMLLVDLIMGLVVVLTIASAPWGDMIYPDWTAVRWVIANLKGILQ